MMRGLINIKTDSHAVVTGYVLERVPCTAANAYILALGMVGTCYPYSPNLKISKNQPAAAYQKTRNATAIQEQRGSNQTKAGCHRHL